MERTRCVGRKSLSPQLKKHTSPHTIQPLPEVRDLRNLDGWEGLDNQKATSPHHSNGVGLFIKLATFILTVLQLTVMQLVIQLVIRFITCLLTASTLILCLSKRTVMVDTAWQKQQQLGIGKEDAAHQLRGHHISLTHI